MTESRKSEGVQADFVDTNSHSLADTMYSERNVKAVQADFGDDLEVGVQADLESETRGSLLSSE